MAVVFAMMASYFLSRTLVPTMMHFLLGSEIFLYQDPEAAKKEEDENWIWRVHSKFDRWFERRRENYKGLLEWALENRGLTVGIFGLFVLLSLPLIFMIGEDFSPMWIRDRCGSISIRRKVCARKIPSCTLLL